ncbi:hypothetical protein Salat_0216800 [Sesamum alatum]|uniref:Uncharacterized protein n=1 Tax=Sesamum alatum TaxID=300844 RepID=A0AAE1YYW7_9LAMI|nr:hypothetical protein Salat_0216800 [Sesamum alatum]
MSIGDRVNGEKQKEKQNDEDYTLLWNNQNTINITDNLNNNSTRLRKPDPEIGTLSHKGCNPNHWLLGTFSATQAQTTKIFKLTKATRQGLISGHKGSTTKVLVRNATKAGPRRISEEQKTKALSEKMREKKTVQCDVLSRHKASKSIYSGQAK